MRTGSSTILPLPNSAGRALVLDAIVDELLITRRQRADGLTLRPVAAQHGVSPMAIHWYVADTDRLLQLLVDSEYTSTGLRRQPDEECHDALRNYFVSTWETSRRYPD